MFSKYSISLASRQNYKSRVAFMESQGKKRRYVYLITYKDGRQYIGVRFADCVICPHTDPYMGSSSEPIDPSRIVAKYILDVFETKEEAQQAEIDLHAKYKVGPGNPNFVNRAPATKEFDLARIGRLETVIEQRRRKDIFKFRHRATGEIFIGRICDLIKRKHLHPKANISWLISGRTPSYKGWQYIETIQQAHLI